MHRRRCDDAAQRYFVTNLIFVINVKFLCFVIKTQELAYLCDSF